jgi:hypothetical protein
MEAIQKGLRVKSNFPNPINDVCLVKLPGQKYSAFQKQQIRDISLPSRATQKGRFAIVTDAGAGCNGRGCALDERR